MWAFYTRISRLASTEVWVTASFLRFPGWSEQCCRPDGLYSFSDFHLFEFPIQSFGNCSKHTNYNWYHHHPHIPQVFLVLWQGLSICLSFYFLLFSLGGVLEYQNPLNGKFSFSCKLALCLFFKLGLGDPSVSQNLREFHASHFLGRVLVCVDNI